MYVLAIQKERNPAFYWGIFTGEADAAHGEDSSC
jgi:hypothetical protein